VAGASHGDVGLLLFGLILSMIILMWFGSMVAGLISKFAWLSYIGAAVIAWTGAIMFFKDQSWSAEPPGSAAQSLTSPRRSSQWVSQDSHTGSTGYADRSKNDVTPAGQRAYLSGDLFSVREVETYLTKGESNED
jgi:hypothetical protein